MVMIGIFGSFGQHAVELAVRKGRHLEKFGQGIARILFGVVRFFCDAVELTDIFQPIDVVGSVGGITMCLIPGFDAVVIHDGRDKFRGPCLIG